MKINNFLCLFLLVGCGSIHPPSKSFWTFRQEALQPNRPGRVVLVGGCFDLLHYGHIEFLKKSREFGDYLVVALEPDKRIEKSKKRNPIHTAQQRAQNLLALEYVNEVVLLPLLKTDKDYFDMVRTIRPNIIAVTEGDPQILNKKKQASEVGAHLLIASPLIGNLSTTNILSKFKTELKK